MKYDQRPSTDEAPCLESPHIRYAPQEHTNPDPDKRGIRVDVEVTDAGGSRFLVEMQREPQEFFSISSASWTSLSTKTPTGSSTATPSMKTRTAR